MDEPIQLKICLNKLKVLQSISTFINLVELYCCYNYLKKLPPLPETLKILKCLHPLPKLRRLSCY